MKTGRALWLSIKGSFRKHFSWKRMYGDDSYGYEYNTITHNKRTLRLKPIRGGTHPSPSNDWEYDENLTPVLSTPPLPRNAKSIVNCL